MNQSTSTIINQTDFLEEKSPTTTLTDNTTPSLNIKITKMEQLQDLNPLSPEVMCNQATVNIGTLGHVGHGKSTLVLGISGIKPFKHSSEEVRNITIRLGYANFKVFKCPKCPKPQCYRSWKSAAKSDPNCEFCKSSMILVRHFSFVDCPGHDCLMATMLNGAAVMDAALLVVAANDTCPQPQTSEHLAAAEIMELKNVVTVQTKVDLVQLDHARSNHAEIREFVKGTACETKPVIPIACTTKHQYNVDVLLQYLVEEVPVPVRDLKSPATMQIVRSFDVNGPGSSFEDLKGGVAGGTLLRGCLKIGQMIEVRPGIIRKTSKGFECSPLITYVRSLYSEKSSLEFAIPGGLIAVGTTLDPTLTKNDRLVGHAIGDVGTLPEIYAEIEVEFYLMKRLIGLQESDPNKLKVHKIGKNETLSVNIGSTTATALVTAVKGNLAKLTLSKPCCVEIGERVSISRNFKGSWRLIGYCFLRHGTPLPTTPCVSPIMTE